jgi:iron(III) transport system substrate-binding protein
LRLVKLGAWGARLAFALMSASAQAQWHTAPAVQSLYEKAKGEGKVVLWGSVQRELDWEAGPFAARFPGIKLEWYADLNAPTKAIAEARAGRHGVDVFHVALGSMIPLAERKLLGTVDWQVFGVPASHTAFDGRAAFTHNIVFTFAYNTKLVSAAELPKTWEDVLDPRWKGKLTGSQFLLPRMIGVLGLAWGEQKATEYARALVDRAEVLVTRAPREAFLQSGERLAAVGEPVNSARLFAAQGLSIGYVIPQPVAASQFAVAVLAKAPHPNAAQLFAAWMASAEGKQARDRLRFDVDVLPGSQNEIYQKLKASGAAFVYETPENMSRREALYKKLTPIIARQQ